MHFRMLDGVSEFWICLHQNQYDALLCNSMGLHTSRFYREDECFVRNTLIKKTKQYQLNNNNQRTLKTPKLSKPG